MNISRTVQDTKMIKRNGKEKSKLPITVIENDNICSGKVNPKTTSSGRKQENEFFASWPIEGLNRSITIFPTSISINTTV